MGHEISYFFALASLAVHSQISAKNVSKSEGLQTHFCPLSSPYPPRFNPIHVNLKIKKGKSSSNTSGSASNYRTDSRWHPMPTTVKFHSNHIKIKLVIC